MEQVYTEPLKSDGYTGGNPGIKRSHSSPNLAQVKKLRTDQVNIAFHSLFTTFFNQFNAKY